MTPPELARNSPIATILEPAVPDFFVEVRNDSELLLAHSLNSSSSHVLAVDVPLGFEQRLNDVLGTTADWQDGVSVLDVLEETFLFQLLDDGLASVKALHALLEKKENSA